MNAGECWKVGWRTRHWLAGPPISLLIPIRLLAFARQAQPDSKPLGFCPLQLRFPARSAMLGLRLPSVRNLGRRKLSFVHHAGKFARITGQGYTGEILTTVWVKT